MTAEQILQTMKMQNLHNQNVLFLILNLTFKLISAKPLTI